MIFQYKSIIIIDANILEVLKCRIRKKVNETLYRGTSRWLRVSQDYVPKEGEDVIETDDIVKKFLASVLRLHI